MSLQTWLRDLTLAELEQSRPDLVIDIIDRYYGGVYDVDVDEAATSVHTRGSNGWQTVWDPTRKPSLYPPVPTRPVPPPPPPHPWSLLKPLNGSKLPWEVTLSDTAWRKLRTLSLADPYREVSGKGLLTFSGKPDPRQPWQVIVEDVYVLSSADTSASSTITADAEAALWLRLLDEGRDPGCLKLWFHSHGRMAPFWSQTDATSIGRELDAQQAHRQLSSGWLLSLVTNATGQLRCRWDCWQRNGKPRLYDELPVVIPEVTSVELDCLSQLADRRIASIQEGYLWMLT